MCCGEHKEVSLIALVVICGFDHYENIDVNPSYEVPEALVRDGIGEPSDVDDPLHDANVSINTVALPVSFANADAGCISPSR